MKIFALLQGFVNLVGLFIIANTYKVKKDLAGKAILLAIKAV